MAFTDPGVGRKMLTAVGPTGPHFTLTLAGAVKCGDPIGFKSGTGFVKADADVAALVEAEFVAMKDGAVGEEIDVATEGQLEFPAGGATLGGVFYASASGLWTETKPDAVQGDATAALGRVIVAATSRTVIHFKTHPAAMAYTHKP